MRRRLLCGLLLAVAGLWAAEPRVVKSLPIPPELAKLEAYLAGIRWQGDGGLAARSDPGPIISRIGASLDPLDQTQVVIPGAKTVRLMFGDANAQGDLAVAGYAEDGEQRGAPFLGFYPTGGGSQPVVVRTFPPLSPKAIAATPEGNFAVLFARPPTARGATFVEQDYPAVGLYDRTGKPMGTLLSLRQLRLPAEIGSIEGARSSNPLIAAAGDRILVYVPLLNEIHEWTARGIFVRKFPVRLPNGKEAHSVSSLHATRDRVVVTGWEASDPSTGFNRGPRALYTEDGERWFPLLPAEDGQKQIVVGTSADRAVVLLRDDLRLVWVE